jgi:pilus assembly protein Flp/PilA
MRLVVSEIEWIIHPDDYSQFLGVCKKLVKPNNDVCCLNDGYSLQWININYIHKATRKEVAAMLFVPTEKGQGLVEYALIIILVALVVIIVLALVGTRITQNLYSKIVSALPGG